MSDEYKKCGQCLHYRALWCKLCGCNVKHDDQACYWFKARYGDNGKQ